MDWTSVREKLCLLVVLHLAKFTFDVIYFSLNISSYSCISTCTASDIDANSLTVIFLIDCMIILWLMAQSFINLILLAVKWITTLERFKRGLCISMCLCCYATCKKRKSHPFLTCCSCLVFFLGLVAPIFTFYAVVWILAYLYRFFDITQLFWRKKNYKMTSFIKFGLHSFVFVFTFAMNLTLIILFSQKKCSSPMITEILSLIMTLIRFGFILFYFVVFEMYVPTKHFNSAKRDPGVKQFCRINKIPYDVANLNTVPEFARFMRLPEIGTSSCISNKHCLSLDLEHILKCHDDLYAPDPSCNPCYSVSGRGNYLIGFHQCETYTSLLIALMNFKSGNDGMFGGGIYFARSIDHTRGSFA